MGFSPFLSTKPTYSVSNGLLGLALCAARPGHAPRATQRSGSLLAEKLPISHPFLYPLNSTKGGY